MQHALDLLEALEIELLRLQTEARKGQQVKLHLHDLKDPLDKSKIIEDPQALLPGLKGLNKDRRDPKISGLRVKADDLKVKINGLSDLKIRDPRVKQQDLKGPNDLSLKLQPRGLKG